MELPPPDFESGASTNFTTPAYRSLAGRSPLRAAGNAATIEILPLAVKKKPAPYRPAVRYTFWKR